MEAILTESGITGRLTRLELVAQSFEEERILRMLADGLVAHGTLFELSKDGVPCGAFTFGSSRREEDNSNG